MLKKYAIFIVALVCAQAVYISYLVRENVRHDKAMREQKMVLLTEFLESSQRYSDTKNLQPVAVPVQPVSLDEVH